MSKWQEWFKRFVRRSTVTHRSTGCIPNHGDLFSLLGSIEACVWVGKEGRKGKGYTYLPTGQSKIAFKENLLFNAAVMAHTNVIILTSNTIYNLLEAFLTSILQTSTPYIQYTGDVPLFHPSSPSLNNATLLLLYNSNFVLEKSGTPPSLPP